MYIPKLCKKNVKSVLICDELDRSREMLVYIMKKWGVPSIQAFENPTFALKSVKPDLELIFINNNMPEMSGVLFVKWLIENNFGHVPVIVLSGMGSEKAYSETGHKKIEFYSKVRIPKLYRLLVEEEGKKSK